MKAGTRPATEEQGYMTLKILEVKKLCDSDFNGRWHLRHLPYSLGYYEHPYPLMREIETVVGIMNKIISG